MYLAFDRTAKGLRFSLRESYLEQGVYLHRELLDLGSDPFAVFVYPGGNSYYVHESIIEALESQGKSPDNDELEEIFWPFLDPAIKRKLEGFRNRSRNRSRPSPLSAEEEEYIRTRVHMVDKRRYNYLRIGELDQSRLLRLPLKFYRPLVYKSRDELEQYFLGLESKLKPEEYSSYVYSFLYLRRYFQETLAGDMPQAMDQDKLDRFFEQEICSLNQDINFWGYKQRDFNLHPYLVRYVIMFIDYPFAESIFMHERMQDFFARSRERFEQARADKSGRMSPKSMSQSFGVSHETLQNMSKRQLTRLYRRLAKKKHPDQGGEHEDFVRLSRAYTQLMRRK